MLPIFKKITKDMHDWLLNEMNTTETEKVRECQAASRKLLNAVVQNKLSKTR